MKSKLQKYKVRIQHYRQVAPKQILEASYIPPEAYRDGHVLAKGGATKVSLIERESSGRTPNVFIGYSFCSFKDTFTKRVGTNIALGRAITLAEDDSEEKIAGVALDNQIVKDKLLKYHKYQMDLIEYASSENA